MTERERGQGPRLKEYRMLKHSLCYSEQFLIILTYQIT